MSIFKMQISIYDLRMTDPIRIKDHMWALKNYPMASCLWMLENISFCIYSNKNMAAYDRCRWTLCVHYMYIHVIRLLTHASSLNEICMSCITVYEDIDWWSFSLLYRYGSPILNIKWHQTLNSAESKVISADKRIVRIWDPSTVRLILLERNKLLM